MQSDLPGKAKAKAVAKTEVAAAKPKAKAKAKAKAEAKAATAMQNTPGNSGNTELPEDESPETDGAHMEPLTGCPKCRWKNGCARCKTPGYMPTGPRKKRKLAGVPTGAPEA